MTTIGNKHFHLGYSGYFKPPVYAQIHLPLDERAATGSQSSGSQTNKLRSESELLHSVYLHQGDIHIRQTAGDNTAVVRYDSNGNIEVIDDGASHRFSPTDVYRNRIFWWGNDGNDTFYNYTSLNTQADGGRGHDRIITGGGHDVIFGGEGNDVINGGSGNDRIQGNDGHDAIYGADGHDYIIAGDGNDLVDGGRGNDRIYGDSGNDRLNGGLDGDDYLDGGSGNDHLVGAAGHDHLSGGAGDDLLEGSSGHDRLYGGSGNDRLYGQSGNDQLFGDSGSDRLYGGDGDDYLDGGNDWSRDYLYGEAGRDTYAYWWSYWLDSVDYRWWEGDRKVWR